jgi:hypothetical protein
MSGSPPLEEPDHVRTDADLEASDLSRSRKASFSKLPAGAGSDNAPSTFWLATDEEVNHHLEMDSTLEEPSAAHVDTTEGAATGEEDLHAALTQVFPVSEAQTSSRSFLESLSGIGTSASPYTFHHHSTTVSQPITPLQGASPAGLGWGSAMPSTPKSASLHSLQLSDVESSSDGDENIEDRIRSSLLDSEPPRLIMPSLSMPDRRPITNRGRAMGNLKICIAGAKGE